MAVEAEKCPVCEAEFLAGALGEDGICDMCKKLWPNAKTSEDRNKQKTPEVKNQESHIEELITKSINAILEDYGVLHKCVCGKLFFKRSPAQKGCGCDFSKETK